MMETDPGLSVILINLALLVVMLVSGWRVFEKANEPGWAALVPLYNVYIMLKIAGKPGWWLLLLLVPLVQIVIGFIATIAFAQSYGKGPGFGIGLVLFGIIFLPLLAFGDAEYIGPQHVSLLKS